jgi:hypothetical protein
MNGGEGIDQLLPLKISRQLISIILNVNFLPQRKRNASLIQRKHVNPI